MYRIDRRNRRRGTVLPMVAVSLVGLCGFVALAADVGMVTVAKTQVQSAADSAALAGARAIDGSESPNLTAATGFAHNAATGHYVLGAAVSASTVDVEHGSYHYDTVSESFQPQFPPITPDAYNLTRATVTRHAATTFARLVGISSFDVSATATAAHRPRDVSVVLDFSGSMNNESDIWNCEGYLGSLNHTPNNLDTVVPKFGHYSSSSANLVCTSTDSRVGKCNITQAALGVPAMVDDYYKHSRGGSPSPAFSAAPNSYDTAPGGDEWLRTSSHSTSTYAKTFIEVNDPGGTNVHNDFEKYGYDFYYLKRNLSLTSSQARDKLDNAPDTVQASLYKGYTQGPKYWGKTFFIWPPSPAGRYTSAGFANHPSVTGAQDTDWRRRFFLKTGGSHPSFGGAQNDNTKLWDSSGNWRDPNGNYVINYKAILAWIKSDPNPFPTQLRAGRLLYYDAIPDDVPASAYTHTNLNSAITDHNQRFWKEYIDYTLGVWRDPYGNIQKPDNPACSYGPDFAWGTIAVNTKPTNGRFMSYADNPERPRHRFWFGPMTMVQFMSDTGLLPGTAHDISLYPAKLGIAAALQDIKNNHPNDLVSMILFCRPQFTNEPAGTGSFTQALYSLSRDYTGMMNSLWYPPNSSTSDIRPYTAEGRLTPRCFSDYNANTATHHGLMLAYNQFSSNATIRSQSVGGNGRRGAQRLVILETDGMANVNTNPAQPFYNGGMGHSYYCVRPGDTFTATGYNESNLLNVVRRICALETDNTVGPGFSTARRPVQVHTVAFGAIFEPSTPAANQDDAVGLLQSISTIGGSVFPGSSTDPDNGYKWCIGTLEERKTKLRQAFSKIMEDGVSVSLVD
jgi:hypothetical protein